MLSISFCGCNAKIGLLTYKNTAYQLDAIIIRVDYSEAKETTCIILHIFLSSIDIKIRLTRCYLRSKCSDLRKYPTYKIRLTHIKTKGFLTRGPRPCKFVRLVKNPTYTPSYASLTVLYIFDRRSLEWKLIEK